MKLIWILPLLLATVVFARRQEQDWETRARQDGFGERLYGREDVVLQEDDTDNLDRRPKPTVDQNEKALFKKLPSMKHRKKTLNMNSYFALWRDYKRIHGSYFFEKKFSFFNCYKFLLKINDTKLWKKNKEDF